MSKRFSVTILLGHAEGGIIWGVPALIQPGSQASLSIQESPAAQAWAEMTESIQLPSKSTGPGFDWHGIK